jgi:SPP1 gp7 family putative phage head morphogenesis protein
MRQTVSDILTDGYEQALHPNEIVSEIEQTVGLTPGQRARVKQRADKMREDGWNREAIREEREQFADQLRRQRAEAIARTETLDAQTEALKDSWRTAQDEGLMPPGTKKRWVSTMDERTSEICEELDGVEVGVDEQFPGGIDGPPAHPNCRSTMTLVFPE